MKLTFKVLGQRLIGLGNRPAKPTRRSATLACRFGRQGKASEAKAAAAAGNISGIDLSSEGEIFRKFQDIWMNLLIYYNFSKEEKILKLLIAA